MISFRSREGCQQQWTFNSYYAPSLFGSIFLLRVLVDLDIRMSLQESARLVWTSSCLEHHLKHIWSFKRDFLRRRNSDFARRSWKSMKWSSPHCLPSPQCTSSTDSREVHDPVRLPCPARTHSGNNKCRERIWNWERWFPSPFSSETFQVSASNGNQNHFLPQ